MGKRDRLRLQKREADKIEKRLKDMGMHTRRQSDGTVHAWGKGMYGWAVSFRWVPKKGWRMDIAQPLIKTNRDLETALAEIATTNHHREKADQAWEKYQKCRSDKAWMEYQGVMALHFARMGTAPGEETDDQG